MSLRVDGRAILELLAENKSESAQLYRRFAAVHELGDLFLKPWQKIAMRCAMSF
ncbi:hypothetical protein [Peptoniphilus asaccharolyticus]